MVLIIVCILSEVGIKRAKIGENWYKVQGFKFQVVSMYWRKYPFKI